MNILTALVVDAPDTEIQNEIQNDSFRSIPNIQCYAQNRLRSGWHCCFKRVADIPVYSTGL